MIDISILENSLNESISYAEYFHAFGYSDNDIIYFRTFDDKSHDTYGTNYERPLSKINDMLQRLHAVNDSGRGVFYIVNGGGHKDEKVTTARAQFVDFDDFSFVQQIDIINDFELEPSIIVKTKKSLHCYWLLEESDITAFRPIQQKLNAYFGSDPVIQNESRVMRLYGFNHHKTEQPARVTLIKFDPELKYTQAEILDALPEDLAQPEPIREAQESKSYKKEFVPKGQRHRYVISKIGEILGKLKDSASDQAILALIETDLLSKCEAPEDITKDINAFRKKYLKTIQTFRARQKAENDDPEYYSKALRAWSAENIGEIFDPERHSWQEVREAYERAQEKNDNIENLRTPAKSDPVERRRSDETDTRQGVTPIKDKTPENAPQSATEAPPEFIDDILKFLAKIQTEDYKPHQTGLKFFDDFTGGGLLAQTLTLLLAAPGAGKTTLLAQLAECMAANGTPVIYLNLEMSREQMLSKAISARLNQKGYDYSSAEILQGYKWTDDDRAIITAEIQEYRQKQFPFIQYNPKGVGTDINEILNYLTFTGDRAKQYKKKAPAIILDYLHLVTGGDDTQERIKKIVKGLKDYAVNYTTFAIAITAVNRASMSNGKITLNSGRDSSNLEYTADFQFSLNWRDVDNGNIDISDPAAMNKTKRAEYWPMILRALKNRGGAEAEPARIWADQKHNTFYGYNDFMKHNGKTPLDDAAIDDEREYTITYKK